MNLNNICIVLVRPKHSSNIGSVCRAMKTCDICDLRIVGNKSTYNEEKVKLLSVHAYDIWENSKEFSNIRLATGDCTCVIGTTRRRGTRRGRLLLAQEAAALANKITGTAIKTNSNNFYNPAGFNNFADFNNTADFDNFSNSANFNSPVNFNNTANKIDLANKGIFIQGNLKSKENKDNEDDKECRWCKESKESKGNEGNNETGGGGRVAFVFGNEETGLTDAELQDCTQIATIQSSKKCGSFNLSHAVQIICYCLFCENLPYNTSYTPVDLKRLDSCINKMIFTLKDFGFFKQVESLYMEHFWRNIFSRAALSEKEVQYIEETFKKLDGLYKKSI